MKVKVTVRVQEYSVTLTVTHNVKVIAAYKKYLGKLLNYVEEGSSCGEDGEFTLPLEFGLASATSIRTVFRYIVHHITTDEQEELEVMVIGMKCFAHRIKM
jgi:hypothetical protein